MRAVVQRVAWAQVRIDGRIAGKIGPGLLAYVGAADGDGPEQVAYIAGKIAHLRIFADHEDKMNRSVLDAGGAVLVVPAFTTMADARAGRRPAFVQAARPEAAGPLFEQLLDALRAEGVTVQAGRFRERMEVESLNDGPVCVLLDSDRLF